MTGKEDMTKSLFDAAKVEEEWRTVPADLGRWANRATAMLNLAKRYHDALERIAEGPGTNSEHRERAKNALNRT